MMDLARILTMPKHVEVAEQSHCWTGMELKDAVEEWQMKRNVPEPRLTTGFLEGTHPVVDCYELKVSDAH